MSAFPSTVLTTEFFALITADDPHVALYISNPGPDNTGTEVTGGTYARQSASFGAITAGAITNDTLLTFNGMPTSNATHWGIFNASSGGDLKAFGVLTTPISSESGDNATIDEGQIVLTFTGS